MKSLTPRTFGAQLLLAAALFALTGAARAQSVQQHVHQHGGDVMPFDLGETVHVFRMTEDGGIQRVIARSDPADPMQVRMIQQHLAREAEAFQKGDFADPAHLHGSAMPGLRELQAAAPRMRITYDALPNGAEIRFQSDDVKLITAVHRWFGAQLSEHGTDARAE